MFVLDQTLKYGAELIFKYPKFRLIRGKPSFHIFIRSLVFSSFIHPGFRARMRNFRNTPVPLKGAEPAPLMVISPAPYLTAGSPKAAAIVPATSTDSICR